MNKIKDSYTKVLSHIQEGDYLKTEPDLHKITNLVEEMAQSEKHRGLDSIRDQQKVILMSDKFLPVRYFCFSVTHFCFYVRHKCLL